MKRFYIYFAAIALCMSATAPASAGLADMLRNGFQQPVVCVPPQVLDTATNKCITPSAAATAPKCDTVAGPNSICLVTSACTTQAMCLKGELKGKCGVYATCKTSADKGPVCTTQNIAQTCTVNGKAGTLTRTINICDGVSTGYTDSPCVANPVTCTPKTESQNCTVNGKAGTQSRSCSCTSSGSLSCAAYGTCMVTTGVICTAPKTYNAATNSCNDANPPTCIPPATIDPATGQCKNPTNTSGCAPQGTSLMSAGVTCVINPAVCPSPAQGQCNPMTSGGLQCGSVQQCKNGGTGGGSGCSSTSTPMNCSSGSGTGTFVRTVNVCNGQTTTTDSTCNITCTPGSEKAACTAANGQPGTATKSWTCGAGGVKNYTTGQCTATPCPSGTTWNATTKQCVKNGGEDGCPTGQVKNDAGQCVGACPPGQIKNEQGQCVNGSGLPTAWCVITLGTPNSGVAYVSVQCQGSGATSYTQPGYMPYPTDYCAFAKSIVGTTTRINGEAHAVTKRTVKAGQVTLAVCTN
ncbi:MAG: hypothetical protein SFX19_05845 [Alphaproteobacteria bacterium]|nr:hypothetical protein [Alphaproteobacteria bacterium]